VVETQVLLQCKRICAFCFGLHEDDRVKKGQIAHIERAANVSLENAAFLCRKHHDDYDSRSRQTKGLTAGELKAYQQSLNDYLKSGGRPNSTRLTHHRTNRKDGITRISLEVYDRRASIYRVANEFVRTVLQDLKPDYGLIHKFAADTDEALFLFDEATANYLTQIYKRAIRVRTIGYMRNQAKGDEFISLAKEQTELATWFSEQFEEIRSRFAPFLQIRP